MNILFDDEELSITETSKSVMGTETLSVWEKDDNILFQYNTDEYTLKETDDGYGKPIFILEKKKGRMQ
jgi:hypothetical protein